MAARIRLPLLVFLPAAAAAVVAAAVAVAAAVVAYPAAAAAAAQPAPVAEMRAQRSPEALRNTSGLPVPRFASLRAGRAFLRAGPGREYPVRWVFIRPGVPLEVTDEWNLWRRVRDAEGAEGWMDRAMLSTERTFLVTRQTRNLHARPDVAAPVVLRAEPGVIGRITGCANRWCRLEIEGRAGWILREHGFGTYPDEPIG